MMGRREFLQLADRYDPRKHDVAGWFISEKLDGTRCFWDGGISRGMPTEQVPWASIIDPKTGQKKAKIKAVATGLWSRYGNPIMAPDWWLSQLPCCPLDGELWAGRGNFQLCRSICGGDTPDERFDKIVFAVYSSPPLACVFGTGQIKNANMVCNVDYLTVEQWVRQRLFQRGERFAGLPIPKRCLGDDFRFLQPGQPFGKEVTVLSEALENTDASVCYLHPQTKLIDIPAAASDQVEEYLQRVLDRGGEGVVIRNPESVWTPKRHGSILKYKPFQDAEARVVGFTSGRETSKGSRLLGKIGALIVDYQGKRLELSGLTDAEREFADPMARDWAASNPGIDAPYWVEGKHFKKSQIVSFKFRELSDGQVPKEARYWRRRDTE
jgi:DNA ligase-1